MAINGDLQLLARDLAEIARRARSLDDMLALFRELREESRPAAPPEWLPGGAFERWRQVFSPGDPEAFLRRLSWDGLPENAVRAALAYGESEESSHRGDTPLPAWTEELGKVLRRFPASADELVGAGPAPELDGLRGAGEPAFAELWIPFVRHARAQLDTRSGAAPGRLGPGAMTDLEQHLLTQLAELSAIAAYSSFERFRANATGLVVAESRAGASRQRRLYTEFLVLMFAGGIVPFLKEYSTLARQLMRFLGTWTESTNEFLGRLDDDLGDISRHFCAGADPGPVVRVEAGLSDRHNGGRRVLGVTFAEGLRLIYKPRDIGVEAAFGGFLEWVARLGLDPAPAPIRALPRDGYGWIQFITQEPAGNLDEVRAYFRRAGVLLILTHLLGGRDLHMDNVVARRHGPFLVDAETLLQPRRSALDAERKPADAVARAERALGTSFLSTGLLTFEESDATGVIREVGGLCGRGGWRLGAGRPCWAFVNTDAILPGQVASVAPERQNVLYLGGEVQLPERFTEEIVDGFTAGYRFLLAHRDKLLEDDGPLRAFAGHNTSLILRPTNLYALLQVRLAAPEYQREGLRRSFAIDSINRVFRAETRRPILWPLAADERRALEDLDVPYFSVAADSTTIVSGDGERITGYLAASGIDVVRERAHSLSLEDLGWQLELLRASLCSTGGAVTGHEDQRVESSAGGLAEGVSEGGGSPDSVPAESLIRAARTLAENIRERAIRADDGSVTWILPAFLRQEGRSDRGVSYYLYHGVSGVALFLSAMGRVSGESSWCALAAGACRPIASALDRSHPHELMRFEGIGACSGLGGVVYALACIAPLLKDDWFLELATRVASHITVEKIGADTRFDVEGGAAGAALGLLALYQRTAEDWLLERAMACGEHLVAKQTSAAGGGAAWPGYDGRMVAGFAHGAAGIACALARLYEATGRRAFREAALRAHAFERTAYSPQEQNWPVLVRDEKGGVRRVIMNAWCHGAPGIALARAVALGPLEDEETAADLDLALAATTKVGFLEADHLCCGNISLTEIMISVSQTLGRPGLFCAAQSRARAVLRRARLEDGFRLGSASASQRVLQPGLFRGSAGVGYGLLRLARPDMVPSVLAFQPVLRGGD